MAQRVIIGGTGLLVTALAGVFGFLSWDRAGQVASVVAALIAVAALGVAVWAVLSGGSGGGSVRVENTGAATAVGPGSRANTGAVASGDGRGDVSVSGTADARAEDGGSANTGSERP